MRADFVVAADSYARMQSAPFLHRKMVCAARNPLWRSSQRRTRGEHAIIPCAHLQPVDCGNSTGFQRATLSRWTALETLICVEHDEHPMLDVALQCCPVHRF